MDALPSLYREGLAPPGIVDNRTVFVMLVYRAFFLQGLTVLDDTEKATLITRENAAHAAAREEMKSLLPKLKLPIDDRGRRRAANRAK